jgi:uncharacterized protein (DUF2147 family)
MNLKFFFLSLFISTISFGQNQIIGKWLTQDKDGYVELYQLKGKYFGKIVWIKSPNNDKGKPKVDDKNPNPALRNTAVLGLVFLKDFVYSASDKEWTNGTIYDPKSGKTYKSTVWLEDNNTLNVRGYWGFIYSTSVWTRVN